MTTEVLEPAGAVAAEMGRAISQARHLAGLTPAEVGRACGAEPAELAEVERGERAPARDFLLRFAAATGFTVTDVFAGCSDAAQRLASELAEGGATRAVEREEEAVLPLEDDSAAALGLGRELEHAVSVGDDRAAESVVPDGEETILDLFDEEEKEFLGIDRPGAAPAAAFTELSVEAEEPPAPEAAAAEGRPAGTPAGEQAPAVGGVVEERPAEAEAPGAAGAGVEGVVEGRAREERPARPPAQGRPAEGPAPRPQPPQSPRAQGQPQQQPRAGAPRQQQQPPQGQGEARRTRWGVPDASQPGVGSETTVALTHRTFKECVSKRFRRVDKHLAEMIYEWTAPETDFTVKVYSTVDARTGVARPAGEDSLRVIFFDGRTRLKVREWSRVLHRRGDWQTRLRETVGALMIRAEYRPECPYCQGEMVVRTRKAAAAVEPGGAPPVQFFGCSNFPKCRGTLTILPGGGTAQIPYSDLVAATAPPRAAGARGEKGTAAGTKGGGRRGRAGGRGRSGGAQKAA